MESGELPREDGSTTSPSRPTATRSLSAVCLSHPHLCLRARADVLLPSATGHDSSITVVYPSGPDAPPTAVHTIRTPSLPYVSLLWVSGGALIAAGHDCQPVLFSGSAEGGWALLRSLDDPSTASAKAGILQPTASSGIGRLNSEAFKTFRSADSRGGAGGGGQTGNGGAGGGSGGGAGGGGTELGTVHQNTITKVKAYEVDAQTGDVNKVSTSGVDGRLVLWEVGKTDGAGAVAGRFGKMGI